MSIDVQEPLLSIREVAEQLGVSEKKIRRLIASGELPALRLGRRQRSAVRVDPAELAHWLYQEPA